MSGRARLQKICCLERLGIMRTPNLNALRMFDAAATGQGIALAPLLLLGDELAQGKLVKLWRDRQSDQNGFYIIRPDRPKPNPARDTLIDWVFSEVGPDRG